MKTHDEVLQEIIRLDAIADSDDSPAVLQMRALDMAYSLAWLIGGVELSPTQKIRSLSMFMQAKEESHEG